MPRITCKTPSTGRSVNFFSVDLPTAWTAVAEASDFSVPDASYMYSTRDVLDNSRAIRPGEIFFMTPVYARNKSTVDCWIEVSILTETGLNVMCPGVLVIPPGDTALVPVQGRSIMKRNSLGATGDQLLMRAQFPASIDVWGSGEEKPSAEHIGVV